MSSVSDAVSAELPELRRLFECALFHRVTLGFAESCTGGLLSAELVKVPGASQVFLGSIVSYANSVKTDLLGVTEKDLLEIGAVSENVALQMARGAKEMLKVDYAVAITGIAGPGGGSSHKPVGTVCFGRVGPGLESSYKTRFDGDRSKIQMASIKFAAEILIDAIVNHKSKLTN